ncbi:MAG: haloacid dehalogenase [Anaerolineaceae bacterium]|jgi:translin|nr:haloacid dehalogenase [Anaerolineaceae bacterium]HNX46649.1 haloacid dehalogenase [Anaerolineaceae bacterium]HPT24239.1 haloacid dehalogenase [Anaerolineaceae bacterium]
MDHLDPICDQIREDFNRKTARRDVALGQARELTRHASLAIRAIHREDHAEAETELEAGRQLVHTIKADLRDDPDLYFAGYTQDAIKEYCEAQLTVAMILNRALPTPQELGAEYPAYVNGMTETLGELRRRCLDLLRPGYSEEVERLLGCMDDIFTQLVTMDYPDAITDGLRRRTDLARGIIERTRADITVSFRQSELERALSRLSRQLSDQQS